ncbi:hypothetical protein EV132_1566 [Rhizobium sullae]|uniref:Uncharacterized protein n=1 Tax=Rhizobium sullae TaxID=50338 RepID=A0A4R3PQ21_RHISU|nr:hypothetical protein EV132_1566 [Rhizobium sullae]
MFPDESELQLPDHVERFEAGRDPHVLELRSLTGEPAAQRVRVAGLLPFADVVVPSGPRLGYPAGRVALQHQRDLQICCIAVLLVNVRFVRRPMRVPAQKNASSGAAGEQTTSAALAWRWCSDIRPVHGAVSFVNNRPFASITPLGSH